MIAADYDNQADEFSLDAPIVTHDSQQWSNYVRGVVKHLQQRNNAFGGVDMVISGNVPQGAGLSSSASLEVAVGTVFQQLYHLPLDGAQIATCRWTARKFANCAQRTRGREPVCWL
ncbi:Galactokinase [Salmonella enterica subsp. enterica serovar Wandsworth str. A4-580]|uniref:Galactokinase n=1 Tax=Salmonella enterica subsp. enterica serovar Wandsworth str. A4-580 TaxID=913086 RepID=G5S8S6_SALET|nr:Galactokinase [Salmonella enterica subsp. enterica serovar Wandsworth str. A4-580]